MSSSSTLRLALAGTLFCLLLAGCGGGGGETSLTSSAGAGSTPGEAESSFEPEASAPSGDAPSGGLSSGETSAEGGAQGGSDAAKRGETGGDSGAGESGAGESSPKAAAGGLEGFRSPSGNIGCYIGPEGARCDIADRSWTAPRPQGCPSQVDSGQGLEVGQSGPGKVVCAGDTALNPDARVLAYGEEIHAGDFTCHSRQAGVECLDDGDGRGFFISKQSYRLF